MKFAIFLLFPFNLVNAENCDENFQKHLQSDLNLSYQEFDQTMGQGFRSLVDENGEMCHEQVADLIEKYIEVNDAKENSLRWHIAQSRASANQYKQAIQWSRSVLLEKEDFGKRALRWNDYVLATIAFLEKDKTALITHRNAIEKAKEEHFGNALNLKLIDSLIKHFDKSYKFAVSHIGK